MEDGGVSMERRLWGGDKGRETSRKAEGEVSDIEVGKHRETEGKEGARKKRERDKDNQGGRNGESEGVSVSR